MAWRLWLGKKDEVVVTEREMEPLDSPGPEPAWANDYTRLIMRAARESQGFGGLAEFLDRDESEYSGNRTATTLWTIPADGSEHTEQEITDPAGLQAALDAVPERPSHRLFLVENLGPATLARLGAHFDVDPQFWADHEENSFWYGINDVADHLPALPSVDAAQSFLRFRFVPARTIIPHGKKAGQPEKEGDQSRQAPISGNDGDATSHDVTQEPPPVLRRRQTHVAMVPAETQRGDMVADLSSKPGVYIVYPSERATMTMRNAAIIQQTTRADLRRTVNPVMFAHASVAVWAKHHEPTTGSAEGGVAAPSTWTSIVLLDPPFIPAHVSATVKRPEYRLFRHRPGVSASPETWKRGANHSHRVAFSKLLESRPAPLFPPYSSSTSAEALRYPFAVLADLFHIVASEWNVANTYLKSELVAIDWNLENVSVGIADLETYRKALFVHRRRISAYEALVAEQHAILGQLGRRAWLPRAAAEDAGGADDDLLLLPPAVRKCRADLATDFAAVRAFLALNSARVDKNIALVGMLLTLQEASGARILGRSVAVLAFISAVFLPFGTVASILDISGDDGSGGGSAGYGPGQDGFWVFWVASAVVVAAVAAGFAVYTGPLPRWQARRPPRRQFWEHHVNETGWPPRVTREERAERFSTRDEFP